MSSSSKDRILARIRAANRAVRADGAVGAGADSGASGGDADAAYAALSRDYLWAHHDTSIVDLFAERTADYRAVVERVPADGLAQAVAQVLSDRVAAVPGPVVVPDGLDPDWLAVLPVGVELASDAPPLSPVALDQMAGVVTACAVAIAETGTIILDHGPGQGRRALSLVPDFHLVIVRSDQIAADLAEAFARVDAARPHTLISGPSATSDIELIRVEGVHGPRTLHVLLTTAAR